MGDARDTAKKKKADGEEGREGQARVNARLPLRKPRRSPARNEASRPHVIGPFRSRGRALLFEPRGLGFECVFRLVQVRAPLPIVPRGCSPTFRRLVRLGQSSVVLVTVLAAPGFAS